MQNLTIRIARPPEATLVDVIDKEMSFETYPEVLKKSVEQGRILLAIQEDKAVGYLRYGYLWEKKLPYIQVIRVLESYRKKGIGRKLVELLENILRKKGIFQLLSSTDKNNFNSQKFHHALGFKDCGELSININDEVEVFFKKRLLKKSH